MTYFKLFRLFFKFGLFTFGGGYAMITFMENTFVKEYKLIDSDTMSDFVATAQIVPGMIALNLAHLIGRYIKGFFGGLISVIGVTLPSVIIISIVAYALSTYFDHAIVKSILEGILAAVFIIIGKAIISIAKSLKHHKWLYGYAIFILLMMVLIKIPIVFVLVSSILLGIMYYLKLMREVSHV
jgi:chromate transporter